LDIGFGELTVAGTPNLAAVPETRLVVTALNRMLHLERPEIPCSRSSLFRCLDLEDRAIVLTPVKDKARPGARAFGPP
jgi:hypothetical protein